MTVLRNVFLVFGINLTSAFLPTSPFAYKNNNNFFSSAHVEGSAEVSTLLSLPTLDQVTSDPFMKQVEYGFQLTQCLERQSSDIPEAKVEELLSAQLKHKNGIRGFFVSYLTNDTEDSGDFKVPNVLSRAMLGANEGDLVSLACMNVIMPTATASMHDDPLLAKSSRMTAERGTKVLLSLFEDIEAVRINCLAILCASCSLQGDENSLEESVNDPSLVEVSFMGRNCSCIDLFVPDLTSLLSLAIFHFRDEVLEEIYGELWLWRKTNSGHQKRF